MLILGEKEMNEQMVAVRRQGKGDAGSQPVDIFINMIVDEIENRIAQ